MVKIEYAIDEWDLRVRERERALRGEEPRRLAHPIQQLAALVDGVHEPAPLGLLGVDKPAGEDQLLREAEAADPREPLRPAPARDDAEVDLRLAELRRARGVAQVAAERELAAAAEREAIDRRDRRLRHRLEEARARVAEPAPLARLEHGQPAHVLDVRACDEGPVARARQHDDPR